MSETTRENIAHEIIAALAETTRRLIVMTDARDFVYLEDGVAFRIMPNATHAREVRITRLYNGRHRMEFGEIRNLEFHPRTVRHSVTTEGLREVFEQATELYLSLGTMSH
ncbi:hypothetical protein [Nocardia asiatica]|uniref:hypothetical protein n=1 Tax=Nocardia asiatica TaxID=209252 RepID=UPI0024553BFF|nr:hypothetical protein [Nocardia asiatica]